MQIFHFTLSISFPVASLSLLNRWVKNRSFSIIFDRFLGLLTSWHAQAKLAVPEAPPDLGEEELDTTQSVKWSGTQHTQPGTASVGQQQSISQQNSHQQSLILWSFHTVQSFDAFSLLMSGLNAKQAS